MFIYIYISSELKVDNGELCLHFFLLFQDHIFSQNLAKAGEMVGQKASHFGPG